MKLTQLRIKGFRAFGRETVLDFAGDVVILVGLNGSGKTSVFDAVEWGLFGVVPRLRGSRDSVGEDYIRNRFMPSVPSEVSLYLADGDRTAAVLRTGSSVLVVDESGTNLSAKKAEAWISQQIAPGRAASATSAVDVFERTNLLGQDRIVDFVRDTNPRDRFDSLSNLLGADIARRFYQYGERWAQVARSKRQEAVVAALQADRALEQLRVRRLDLESDAELVPGAAAERVYEELAQLSSAAAGTGLVWPKEMLQPNLERMIAILRDLVTQGETGQARADEALSTITALDERAPIIDDARRRLPALKTGAGQARTESRVATQSRTAIEMRLAGLQDQERALKRSLAAVRRDRRDLAQFLTLARTHVKGDRCPVCEQRINESHVLNRLEDRIAELPPQETALVGEGIKLTSAIEADRQFLAEARNEEQRLGQAARESARSLAAATRDIDEWEVAFRELRAAWTGQDLAAARKAVRGRKARLGRMLKRISDLLQQATATQAKSGLVALAPLELKATADRQRAIAQRDEIAGIAELFDALVTDAKGSEIDIVEAAINRQLPTLRAVYQRLNPHPLFDSLDVRFRALNERGEVYYRAAQGGTSGNASMMFSSAQMNAVAVSVFLALNLLRRDIGFSWFLLDDPIQNMDDYNVLGLVDLLRAVRGSRQLVVSTHDDQLGELFQRKLRPAAAGMRTVVHRFESGDEQAPRVLTTRAEYAPTPYVLPELTG